MAEDLFTTGTGLSMDPVYVDEFLSGVGSKLLRAVLPGEDSIKLERD
jgi:hypothetical protein